MMIATCNGPSVRSGPSVAGAAAFDIQDPSLDGEDFFFLGREQLIDLRDASVGRLLHGLDHRFVPYLHGKKARLGHADGRKLVQRHVSAVGIDLHRLKHRCRGSAGSQTAQFMLERLGGALHAALQLVDIEFIRGHNTLPLKLVSRPSSLPLPDASQARQPATTVPWPVPRRIAPIEPGSAIENTMIGSDGSRASANAVASMTL